jgi:hypothetical protein
VPSRRWVPQQFQLLHTCCCPSKLWPRQRPATPANAGKGTKGTPTFTMDAKVSTSSLNLYMGACSSIEILGQHSSHICCNISSFFFLLDIDECALRKCYGRCINLPGTYTCTCPRGTSGDPTIPHGCVKSHTGNPS